MMMLMFNELRNDKGAGNWLRNRSQGNLQPHTFTYFSSVSTE
ncbi:hypothetical protein [Paenibacillus arenosi]|nr:hypothetical protein [Paenibacillus arenosi]